MPVAASLRWCVHPQLARGEALSWWLHRFAWANALSNHTLASQVLGGRAFWPRDVDRFAPIAMLDRLADGFGIDAHEVADATLRRYEGILFPVLTAGGWLPWITPLGVFHRTHRHHGHAFCPRCLDEGRPLSITGRLAFEVACTRHHRALCDACPRCDAPITFARVSLEQPGRYPCPQCGFNLTTGVSLPLNARALAFEHRCHRVLRDRHALIAGTQVCAHDFFAGARILLRGLYGKAHINGLTDATKQHALRWPRGRERPLTPFEHWRLDDRMHALAALEAYLRDWPEPLLRDAQRSHVYRCRFELRGAVVEPSWIVDALDQLPPVRSNRP